MALTEFWRSCLALTKTFEFGEERLANKERQCRLTRIVREYTELPIDTLNMFIVLLKLTNVRS